MKILFVLACVLCTNCVFAQGYEIVLHGDSLTIVDERLVNNPFNFGADPLTYLTTKIPGSPPDIEISLISNLFYVDKIDSSFSIKFETDEFYVYQLRLRKNILTSAVVYSNRFKTSHGIQTGMTKAEIIKLLSMYPLETIPKYLILSNVDTESLRLIFDNETLTKIEFYGYID
jgi:hypothetical protein